MNPAHLQRDGATRQQGEHGEGTHQMNPSSKHHTGKESLRELATWETCKKQSEIVRNCNDLFTSQVRKIQTENGNIFFYYNERLSLRKESSSELYQEQHFMYYPYIFD